MKKALLLILALLLCLAGCGTPDTPDTPDVPDTPAKNLGGFLYDSVTAMNGASTVDYPEFTGLDGAGDLDKLNSLIKEDAMCVFAIRELTEDNVYTGTFTEFVLNGNILTVEFDGSYAANSGYNYAVHFYASYDIVTSKRLTADDILGYGKILDALKNGTFVMPKSEAFVSTWESQKAYITKNAGNIIDAAKKQSADSAFIPEISVLVKDGKTYLCVAVTHDLYDFAVIELS